MRKVAVAVICKTPTAGKSKTRLCPPLEPAECAALSACFIRDLTQTIHSATANGDAAGYAVYTPLGTEADLLKLIPAGFGLVPQGEGDLGARLLQGIEDLLEAGHAGAILINSDSPTLPRSILRSAIHAVLMGDNVVLSPAIDGGYTLIGLSRPHPRLFEDIPWSTSAVYQLTLDRAHEIGLPVMQLYPWYDIDDAGSLEMLRAELEGKRPAFSSLDGAEAPATRRYFQGRQAVLARAS